MFSLKSYGFSPPPLRSTLATCAVIVSFFVAAEYALRSILLEYQHIHPIMQNDLSVAIFSRHIAVDFLACAMCAALGWQGRHVLEDLVQRVWHRHASAMSQETHEVRMYTFQPESCRIGTFFLAYQIKNLYDSYVWNDGPEFLFHHVLSMLVSW